MSDRKACTACSDRCGLRRIRLRSRFPECAGDNGAESGLPLAITNVTYDEEDSAPPSELLLGSFLQEHVKASEDRKNTRGGTKIVTGHCSRRRMIRSSRGHSTARSARGRLSRHRVPEVFFEPTKQIVYPAEHLSSESESLRRYCHVLVATPSSWKIREKEFSRIILKGRKTCVQCPYHTRTRR